MLGSKRKDENLDIAKVFFQSFSNRVSLVEAGLRNMWQEIERLKGSTERFQVSDLVLLERLQRSEAILEESLSWMKKLMEYVVQNDSTTPALSRNGVAHVQSSPTSVPSLELRPIISPSGEAGSLSSITTTTELQVLSLLAEKGALPAPEIGKVIGRSREHTARLMKRLYQEGYVNRDHARIPFRYALVERVRQTFTVERRTKEMKQRSAEGEKAVAAPPA